MRSSSLIYVSFAVSAAIAGTSAQAGSPFLTAGDTVAPPVGFVEMCRNGGSLCQGTSASGEAPVGEPIHTGAITTHMADLSDRPSGTVPAPVAPQRIVLKARFASAGHSHTEYRQLQKVNDLVNRRVYQQTDIRTYGRNELWQRSGIGRGARGDCEDIAIEKRLQLLDAGFDPNRLSFAVVYQSAIGLHTLLLVRTEEGDYVLDSRTGKIRRWDQTQYRWLSVQDYADPLKWHSLSRRITVAVHNAPADRVDPS